MIQWLTHQAKSIKGFPIGDSALRRFPVYLPPNYDSQRIQPYPLIFLLAGYGDLSEKYVWQKNAFQKSLPEQLDEAITHHVLEPVIVVFPDANTRLGGSQYINSPVLGNYMDYLCDELVSFIDSQFHTYAQADYRAIMGHSSGGFGALVTGMLRPDVFRNLCSSAGDCFYELLYLPCITPAIAAIEQFGSVEQFVMWFLKHPEIGMKTHFDAMMTFAMAPCFAPNRSAPIIMGDLFFDPKTGALIDEVWQRYLAWDPLRMADRYADSLKKMRFIQLDCGLQDPYGMQWGHRQIALKLEALAIDYELNEYPGKHGGHSFRNFSRIQNLVQKMLDNVILTKAGARTGL